MQPTLSHPVSIPLADRMRAWLRTRHGDTSACTTTRITAEAVAAAVERAGGDVVSISVRCPGGDMRVEVTPHPRCLCPRDALAEGVEAAARLAHPTGAVTVQFV